MRSTTDRNHSRELPLLEAPAVKMISRRLPNPGQAEGLLPHAVELLQRHAFRAEDCVRDRQVKDEVRERELDQEASDAKGLRATAHWKLDSSIEAGFEGGGVDGLEIRDRTVDARVEIGERRRARSGRGCLRDAEHAIERELRALARPVHLRRQVLHTLDERGRYLCAVPFAFPAARLQGGEPAYEHGGGDIEGLQHAPRPLDARRRVLNKRDTGS